jgi:5'-nucleotidase (lipoprotein e(P4) family)
MQTAAEYRASCYQAYNLATARLEELHQKKTDKPHAVIMDLDETVLDNSGFQAMCVRSGLVWDLRLWQAWEQDFNKVALIPGAKEFIDKAKNLPVAVIFVSNRDEEFRKETRQALDRLGIPVTDDSFLKLKDEKLPSDDKTSRFKQVEATYEVLLYVGDNLRDFDETLKFPQFDAATTATDLEKAIKDRKDKVDASQVREAFGKNWIILPNPTYGEWPKPLGRGFSDFDRLTREADPKPVPQVSSALQPCNPCMTEKMIMIVIIGCSVFAIEGAFVLWLLYKLTAGPSKDEPLD